GRLVAVTDEGADERDRLLRLLRRGHAAGPDRPDRLVGDHDLGEPRGRHIGEIVLDLLAQLAIGLVAVALLLALADTQDRHEPGLDVLLGLLLGLVHLPVACEQGCAGHQEATPAPSSAATPGRVLPSTISSVAPPPVERWSTRSASPNWASAAAESPPPTTVR